MRLDGLAMRNTNQVLWASIICAPVGPRTELRRLGWSSLMGAFNTWVCAHGIRSCKMSLHPVRGCGCQEMVRKYQTK
jgi:hypothetical protein